MVGLGLSYCEGLRAFDVDAAFEVGSGPDEGDQVGCVDGPPAFLGGLDELEGHRERGRAGAGAAGDLGPKTYRAKGTPSWAR